MLLHLVHATEQPQSKIWRQKKAPFIAHLWWLVLPALHTHTHTSFGSKEEGFQNPFSQLLAVIDRALLITKEEGSPGCAVPWGARPSAPDPREPHKSPAGARGCSPPRGRLFNFLRFMFFFFFFFHCRCFIKMQPRTWQEAISFSFLCTNRRDFFLPSGKDGVLLM